MLSIIRTCMLALATVALVACGGGGGGDDTPNFAGTYQLSTAVVSSNTCGTSVANIPASQGGATQNGRNITWVESSGNYAGSVDADNGGFTVITSGNGALVTLSLRSAGGNSYAAKLTASGACAIVWTGTAIKTS